MQATHSDNRQQLSAYEIERTPRLTISVLCPDDARAMFEITNDPAITGAVQILEGLSKVSDATALLAGQESFFGGWRDGLLVGVVYVHEHARGGLEIGYWIATRHAGLGYATELASSVISHLRNCSRELTIVAECRPENLRSWRVLEKLGFLSAGAKGERPGRELLRLCEK